MISACVFSFLFLFFWNSLIFFLFEQKLDFLKIINLNPNQFNLMMKHKIHVFVFLVISGLETWFSSVKRWSLIFVVVGVGSRLDVFELVDFPESRCFLEPIKFSKALGSCFLEQVVVLSNMERQLSVAVFFPVLWLVHIESAPGQLIFLAIVIGYHQLNGIFQIKRLTISKLFLRQVNRNVLIALLDSLELSTRLPIIGELSSSM